MSLDVSASRLWIEERLSKYFGSDPNKYRANVQKFGQRIWNNMDERRRFVVNQGPALLIYILGSTMNDWPLAHDILVVLVRVVSSFQTDQDDPKEQLMEAQCLNVLLPLWQQLNRDSPSALPETPPAATSSSLGMKQNTLLYSLRLVGSLSENMKYKETIAEDCLGPVFMLMSRHMNQSSPSSLFPSGPSPETLIQCRQQCYRIFQNLSWVSETYHLFRGENTRITSALFQGLHSSDQYIQNAATVTMKCLLNSEYCINRQSPIRWKGGQDHSFSHEWTHQGIFRILQERITAINATSQQQQQQQQQRQYDKELRVKILELLNLLLLSNQDQEPRSTPHNDPIDIPVGFLDSVKCLVEGLAPSTATSSQHLSPPTDSEEKDNGTVYLDGIQTLFSLMVALSSFRTKHGGDWIKNILQNAMEMVQTHYHSHHGETFRCKLSSKFLLLLKILWSSADATYKRIASDDIVARGFTHRLITMILDCSTHVTYMEPAVAMLSVMWESSETKPWVEQHMFVPFSKQLFRFFIEAFHHPYQSSDVDLKKLFQGFCGCTEFIITHASAGTLLDLLEDVHQLLSNLDTIYGRRDKDKTQLIFDCLFDPKNTSYAIYRPGSKEGVDIVKNSPKPFFTCLLDTFAYALERVKEQEVWLEGTDPSLSSPSNRPPQETPESSQKGQQQQQQQKSKAVDALKTSEFIVQLFGCTSQLSIDRHTDFHCGQRLKTIVKSLRSYLFHEQPVIQLTAAMLIETFVKQRCAIGVWVKEQTVLQCCCLAQGPIMVSSNPDIDSLKGDPIQKQIRSTCTFILQTMIEHAYEDFVVNGYANWLRCTFPVEFRGRRLQYLDESVAKTLQKQVDGKDIYRWDTELNLKDFQGLFWCLEMCHRSNPRAVRRFFAKEGIIEAFIARLEDIMTDAKSVWDLSVRFRNSGAREKDADALEWVHSSSPAHATFLYRRLVHWCLSALSKLFSPSFTNTVDDTLGNAPVDNVSSTQRRDREALEAMLSSAGTHVRSEELQTLVEDGMFGDIFLEREPDQLEAVEVSANRDDNDDNGDDDGVVKEKARGTKETTYVTTLPIKNSREWFLIPRPLPHQAEPWVKFIFPGTTGSSPQDVVVYCERSVAIQCPFFHKMFFEEGATWKEARHHETRMDPDVSIDTFIKILIFLSTGGELLPKISSGQELIDLIFLSEEYQLPSLRQGCFDRLSSDADFLSVPQLVDILEWTFSVSSPTQHSNQLSGDLPADIEDPLGQQCAGRTADEEKGAGEGDIPSTFKPIIADLEEQCVWRMAEKLFSLSTSSSLASGCSGGDDGIKEDAKELWERICRVTLLHPCFYQNIRTILYKSCYNQLGQQSESRQTHASGTGGFNHPVQEL